MVLGHCQNLGITTRSRQAVSAISCGTAIEHHITRNTTSASASASGAPAYANGGGERLDPSTSRNSDIPSWRGDPASRSNGSSSGSSRRGTSSPRHIMHIHGCTKYGNTSSNTISSTCASCTTRRGSSRWERGRGRSQGRNQRLGVRHPCSNLGGSRCCSTWVCLVGRNSKNETRNMPRISAGSS